MINPFKRTGTNSIPGFHLGASYNTHSQLSRKGYKPAIDTELITPSETPIITSYAKSSIFPCCFNLHMTPFKL